MAKATVPREFDLSRERVLDEVDEKLTARASAFQMPFSVKGGVGGIYIEGPKEKNLDVALNVLRKAATLRCSQSSCRV